MFFFRFSKAVIYLYSLIGLALLSPDLLANDECELTDEYKAARSQAYSYVKGSDSPYYKCHYTMSEAYFWKAVAKCVSENKKQNIGSDCSRLVSSGQYPVEEADTLHCEVFKPANPKEEFLEMLDYLVSVKNIKKCSSQE